MRRQQCLSEIEQDAMLAMQESGIDAVDGFSTGTSVPSMWGAAEAPNDSEGRTPLAGISGPFQPHD